MIFDYHLYLLFFFKQKTAYELRISDWSSYVCSSDLPAKLGVGHARFGPAGRAGHCGISNQEPGRTSRPVATAAQNNAPHNAKGMTKPPTPAKRAIAPVTKNPAKAAGQIGRASCRERVCQYV